MRIKNLFRKKRKLKIKLRKVGLIMSTSASLNSGVNDKFNKEIIVYKSVEVDGNKIIFGKIIESIPYTEEEAKNLEKIKKIPLIEKKYWDKLKFYEGEPFGRIIN